MSTTKTMTQNLNQASQAALDLQDKVSSWQLDQVRFAQTQAEVTARQTLKAAEAASALVRQGQQAMVDAFAPSEG